MQNFHSFFLRKIDSSSESEFVKQLKFGVHHNSNSDKSNITIQIPII